MVVFNLFSKVFIGQSPVSKNQLNKVVLVSSFSFREKVNNNNNNPINRDFKTFILLFFLMFAGCVNELNDEGDMLNMINTVRTTGYICQGETYSPVGIVKWDSKLEKAAIMHCNYMDSIGELSHCWKDGTALIDRLLIVGYRSELAAENIAQGAKSEADALNAWLNNPPHCKAIMFGAYNIVAVAQKGEYWTMVLGCN